MNSFHAYLDDFDAVTASYSHFRHLHDMQKGTCRSHHCSI